MPLNILVQTGSPVHASSNMLVISHVDAHAAHTQITEGETKVWAKAKKDREKGGERKREREGDPSTFQDVFMDVSSTSN